MAQGGKRLLLGDRVHEYRAGQYLVVTAALPVTGALPRRHRDAVARPRPRAAPGRHRPAAARGSAAPRHLPVAQPAIATGDAGPDLLDAVVRLVRLLDRPDDVPVLAPLIEREILWRLLTGPHGAVVRQIGLADSGLTHISRADPVDPRELRRADARRRPRPPRRHEPVRVPPALPRGDGDEPAAVPEAHPAAGGARRCWSRGPATSPASGHLVGYDSPSQFNREYRRLFGDPPGRDVAKLRTTTPETARHLP